MKTLSVCYYSAPLPRQKQFKRINTVGNKGKEKRERKRMGTFFAFFSLLAFCYFITSTSCIFHIISLTSLPLTLVSSSHFSLPFMRTSPLVWLFINRKNPKKQNNEENHSPTLTGMTFPWHCGFFLGSRSMSQWCLFTFQAPQLEAELRLCRSLFLALCRETAITLQGHFTPELTRQRCRFHIKAELNYGFEGWGPS